MKGRSKQIEISIIRKEELRVTVKVIMMEVFKQIEGQFMRVEFRLIDIQMENSKYKQIDSIQLGMILCKQID